MNVQKLGDKPNATHITIIRKRILSIDLRDWSKRDALLGQNDSIDFPTFTRWKNILSKISKLSTKVSGCP